MDIFLKFLTDNALWVLLFLVILVDAIVKCLTIIAKHFQKLSENKVEIHRLRVEEARLKSQPKGNIVYMNDFNFEQNPPSYEEGLEQQQ